MRLEGQNHRSWEGRGLDKSLGKGPTTHLALIQSSMVGPGFPIDTGSLLSAYRSDALRLPEPGNKPPLTGNVESVLVARNKHPSFNRRYWNAFESLV